MGRFKRFVSTIAAIAVMATSALSVFAATSGSITIQNATIDSDYAAYKIFDATVNGTSVNYKVIEDDSLEDFYDDLFAAGSPFSADASGNVSISESGDPIGFLKGILTEANIEDWGLTPAASETASSETVSFSGLDFGYYFITSSLGAAVSITSAIPDVTIIDKNQGPSWEPEDPDDYDPEDPDGSTSNGKFVSADGTTYGKESTAAIGDKVYFKINSYAPKYNGETQIISYTFTDELAAGFTYNNDAALYVNGTKTTTGFTATKTVNADGSTTIVYTYVLPDGYQASDLSITYTANVDTDAVADNINTAKMDWTYIPYVPEDPTGSTTPTPTPTPSDTRDPSDSTPTPDESTTDTYVFSFEVIKYAESVAAGNELEGAEFRLYSDSACTTEIPVVKVSDGNYRVAQTGEQGVVIVAGDSVVFGFDEGTYYLKETKAPDNYNELENAINVEIDTTGSDAATVAANPVAVNVINHMGSVLPSTGGMGTVIFVVAGVVIMISATAGLVIRKRHDSKAE